MTYAVYADAKRTRVLAAGDDDAAHMIAAVKALKTQHERFVLVVNGREIYWDREAEALSVIAEAEVSRFASVDFTSLPDLIAAMDRATVALQAANEARARATALLEQASETQPATTACSPALDEASAIVRNLRNLYGDGR